MGAVISMLHRFAPSTRPDFFGQVQRSTEHMCSPLRELIANLQKAVFGRAATQHGA